MQGLQVTIQRYDVWTEPMEKAFGTADLTMLSSQNSPFTVQEQWTNPVTRAIEAYEYTGCWFSSLGRNIRSDDTRIVNVSATLVYVTRKKVNI